MNDLIRFSTPLSRSTSIQSNAPGRVQLPSLTQIFPFEGTPPFSLSTEPAHAQPNDNLPIQNNVSNANVPSSSVTISASSSYDQQSSSSLYNQSKNQLNNENPIQISEPRHPLPFPYQHDNSIYNLINHEKSELPTILPNQKNDPYNGTSQINQNYGTFNSNMTPTIHSPAPQFCQLRSPIEQIVTTTIPNFANPIQSYQPFINHNNAIFQPPQPQQFKVQPANQPFQYITTINTNLIQPPPPQQPQIDYAIQPNFGNNRYFVNGIKPNGQFKVHQINASENKAPIYSYRMRSGRKFSEKELLDITINPIEINFLPKEFWLTPQITIKQVVQGFFKARSTKNLRFEHKLWNALILSTHYPELISILGIYWISNDILKVNRDIFGALINVTKPAAALFNSQGSFLTHGFVEVSKEEALKIYMIKDELVEDVDESVVRLFRHSAGLLKATSHKGDLVTCRWNK